MPQPFDQMAEFLANKNIALVGNSRKVLGQSFPVDDHDVVIRMNFAWQLPQAMQEAVGTRTDLLCVSGAKKEINDMVATLPRVMYMSPKSRDLLTDATRQKLYFYPTEWWQSLYETLGARPSTGCMAVDMVRRVIGEGHLTLYGFDFFQSDSWHKRYSLLERLRLWLGLQKPHPHDGDQEAAFIKAALPREQLTIVPTRQSEAS
ncbi:glycosyltransferase family 29 protein [Thiomicrospira sp. WB1]|uniref:glycosyltransferase family 29 protein n=1 Tax=Thiomicrospira sp. WB1 TaxID=1685380 RepID=UPI000746BC13|nr:glycosyltransferase family 29 protein [Thiomicrospira sp. WB1]KUJ73006.1 hypothetical protein AVO41_04380 [Thiomicrospira sp. WB1]